MARTAASGTWCGWPPGRRAREPFRDTSRCRRSAGSSRQVRRAAARPCPRRPPAGRTPRASAAFPAASGSRPAVRDRPGSRGETGTRPRTTRRAAPRARESAAARSGGTAPPRRQTPAPSNSHTAWWRRTASRVIAIDRGRPAREPGGGASRERERECEQTHGEDGFREERLTDHALRERGQLVGQRRPRAHDASIGEIPERTLAVRNGRRAQVVDEVIAVEAAERAAERVEAVQEGQQKNGASVPTSACLAARAIA